MRRICILYCVLVMSFLLGTYRGYVALWEYEDPEPIKVFPYSVKFLPESDRELLEKGIHIKDLPELTARTEDLMS